MSPASFHRHHQHGIINGPRPSPLTINKDSQLIHKQSSSSSNVSSSCIGGQTTQQIKTNKPIIVYTHSPKVIHTEARDFMGLVQKLTGRLSGDRNCETTLPPVRHRRGSGVTNEGSKSKIGDTSDNHEKSSILTGDANGCGAAGCINSPCLNLPKDPYFADISLFTPTASYFSSPNPVHRYSDSDYASSPSTRNSISPSALG